MSDIDSVIRLPDVLANEVYETAIKFNLATKRGQDAIALVEHLRRCLEEYEKHFSMNQPKNQMTEFLKAF
ncbi:MAG: hypothetical protein HYV97_09890 [Bdellovibrio sp.]|nr:hypothetical protein [Bdellovibrio sp.]